MRTRVLQIHPGDDVLVALTDLRAEEEVSFDGIDLRVQQDVRSKHKVAVRDVGAGETVRMYGVVVGRATRPIPRGGILTTENLRHEAEPFEVRESRFEWSPPDVSRWRGRTFDGIHRPD
ncbi:MAG TPA: UxaA family hydrolase, partial [Rhodothermales bacterium]